MRVQDILSYHISKLLIDDIDMRVYIHLDLALKTLILPIGEGVGGRIWPEERLEMAVVTSAWLFKIPKLTQNREDTVLASEKEIFLAPVLYHYFDILNA